MKVGIITMHSVYNYGTQLQAFATQEKLKSLFGSVEFIDYRRNDTYGKGLIKHFTEGNIVKFIVFMPTYLKWQKIFRKFQKKYLNISDEKYLSMDEFNSFIDKYDLYFTGSDQVWNTGWNNGIIPPYYLSFVNKNKPKYSYAASFGIDRLSSKDVLKVKKYLSEYSKISVREETGLKIINEQLFLNNAIRILDPTLAMPASFWRKYSGKIKIKQKYILLYVLKKNKKIDEYAKKISKKTGLTVYRFCTRYDQIFRYGKPIIIPSVFDFISLIDNAEYVLTDSFHATAFCMNLHTHPICIYPEKYSNRLSDFLKLLGYENECCVKKIDDFSVLNKKIDYNLVDQILNRERKKTNEFLNKIKQELK